MDNNPLVSIIIPTFNRAHLIGETLDSILEQTYTNWECVIIDDGSNDNTVLVVNDYVRRDKRFKFFKRPSCLVQGGNDARNYGFEVSSGDFIQWFDSDDIMLKDYLQEKINFFEENILIVINIGICNGLVKKEVLPELIVHNSDNLFKDFLLWKYKIITQSPMFRKDFLKDKQLFRSDIKRGQETEFFSRLFFSLPSSSYVIIDKPLVFYREHSESISNKSKLYNSSYKKSQFIVFNQNLGFSLILGDKKLIRHVYILLVDLFYDSIKNNDLTLSNEILKQVVSQLKKYYFFKAVSIKLIGIISINIPSKSVFLKKIIKKCF